MKTKVFVICFFILQTGCCFAQDIYSIKDRIEEQNENYLNQDREKRKGYERLQVTTYFSDGEFNEENTELYEEYDTNGNVVTQIVYEAGGNKFNEYKYDKNNNLIEWESNNIEFKTDYDAWRATKGNAVITLHNCCTYEYKYNNEQCVEIIRHSHPNKEFATKKSLTYNEKNVMIEKNIESTAFTVSDSGYLSIPINTMIKAMKFFTLTTE